MRRRLGWALTPIAIIVGAYHGLLLAVVTARPLWNTGPTVVAAMLSFVATGIAAVMLVHLVRMRLAGRLVEGEHLSTFLDDMTPVRNVLVATLVVQLCTFFLWWLSLNFGSLQDTQALTAANAAYGALFWWRVCGAVNSSATSRMASTISSQARWWTRKPFRKPTPTAW